ncbi:hypothetical protein ABMA27_014210 [Loxostege sticticalis]|uniref:YqaJ viral recombinase domain-containing protein n=1 Tax=Loxostege sticticalis TaxID=481309 RepID=A0ABR3ID38_LOXSC
MGKIFKNNRYICDSAILPKKKCKMTDHRISTEENMKSPKHCDDENNVNETLTNGLFTLPRGGFVNAILIDAILVNIDLADAVFVDKFHCVSTSAGQPEESKTNCGRRIIDIQYFFTKLKEISNHGPLDCGISYLVLIGEKQIGLKSKFTLLCKLCNTHFVLENDSNDNMDLNKSAVAGAIAIGYISNMWEDISLETMNSAAKKERDIAIAEGRVDADGIPVIDVIADGCYSKRTYKKNYSALSGAAAIIGRRTGEVLFLGVKNKYCCICAQAEKNKVPCKQHKCYKNYSGPSTGMETAIILEGFKSSIEMHNLIYGRMIADGDSATYSKILQNNPYKNITVQKIECRNHILRNMCNKLVQLKTDTRFPLNDRKNITQDKVMQIRRSIRRAIDHHKSNSESENRAHIEPLYNDIMRAHSHAFGDHSRCKPYFCSKTTTAQIAEHEKSVNKHFFSSSLWTRICFIISSVASHAPSLINDVDSNSVERYNSIVAKLVGGKRINYSLKGSYQNRCNAAVISFNTKKTLSLTYKKAMGRSPQGKIKTLEERRLKRILATNKLIRKKNRKLFYKGEDANYGSNCEKEDKPPELLEIEKRDFLKNLERSEGERKRIERETVLQSSCSEWLQLRKVLLTASNFGQVIKRRKNLSCCNLVKNLSYKKNISNIISIRHGRDNEKIALQQLSDQQNVKIDKCGLFIDQEYPFLGATPDGLIADDFTVEIKCPSSAYKLSFEEALNRKKIPFYKKNTNGDIVLNKQHNWYFQIQGQLHVTRRSKCLFAVWLGEDIPLKTDIIERDDNLWEQYMKQKLIDFYLDWPQNRISFNIEVPPPTSSQ